MPCQSYTTHHPTHHHSHPRSPPHPNINTSHADPHVSQPQAQLVREVSGGEWVVEAIAGVDEERNLVFVTGKWGGWVGLSFVGGVWCW